MPGGQAVDPMYLILSEKAYQIWVEQHYPHVPKVAEVQAVLRVMRPKNRGRPKQGTDTDPVREDR